MPGSARISLRSEHLEPAAHLGGKVVATRLPCLIAVSGYTGSGKSSLAKMLVRRLDFQPVVLATSRPPAANEREGEDYHFISQEQFMAGLQSGEIIGCEGGYGNYYGVPKIQVEALIASGKSGVVVVGPSLMDSLRQQLGERADLHYRSILVRLPGDPAERYAEIVRRIEKRAREEGREATDRLAKVSIEALNGYDGRAVYYDYELINGDFKAAGEELRDYVAAVWEGQTLAKTTRIPINNTPGVLLGRYLLGKLLGKIRQTRFEYASYAAIKEQVEAAIGQEMLNFLRAVYREYHPTASGEGMENDLTKVQRHILDVCAAILQGREPISQLSAETSGLGKLTAETDQTRGLRNLGQLAALAAKFSAEELLLLAAFHDVTKPAAWYLHPERTYDVFQRFQLTKDLLFDEAEKELYKLTTRYHILLMSCFMPDYSGQAIVDFMGDEQVRQYLKKNDNSIDLSRAARLLDSLALLTVADFTSYGAAMKNLKVEWVLRLHDLILNTLAENSTDWSAATGKFRALLPQLNKVYLGMIVGISDPDMDQHPRLDYYWQIMDRQLEVLIAEKKLTPQDKQNLLENAHLLANMPYPPTNYLARINEQGALVSGLTQKPSAAYFRFALLALELVKQLKSPDQFIRCCFVRGNGKPVSDNVQLKEVAWELWRLFGQRDLQPVIDGKIVYFLDQAGERVRDLEVLIDDNGVGNARELNFKFYNVE